MLLHPRRAGYTLLEVVLAMTIGAVLMAGLYTALELTLRHAQAGREKVEQATLARSLFTRIAGDITPNLPPPKPAQSGSSSGTSGGSAGPSGANTTTQNSGSSSSSSASSTGTIQGLNGTVTFNFGVQGDSAHLVLFVSRVPRELDAAWIGDAAPTVSDLRQITYWLSSSGLARQEIKLATSDDAQNALSGSLPDDPSLVIAEEVQSLTFQYWDGANWQDSWDGTQTPSSGGSNPQGPPAAIAITLGLVIPGSSTESGGPALKSYRHVIVLQTANGAVQNTITNSSATTSTSGTTSP